MSENFEVEAEKTFWKIRLAIYGAIKLTPFGDVPSRYRYSKDELVDFLQELNDVTKECESLVDNHEDDSLAKEKIVIMYEETDMFERVEDLHENLRRRHGGPLRGEMEDFVLRVETIHEGLEEVRDWRE
jgi:predicted RNA-binding protein with EMAP domain